MTGAIVQNAEIDCFARAGGAAGQRYQVRVVETSGAATLLFEVVRPDGTTVCGPTGSAEASCLLDAAGTNRIYVYASGGLQTANYRIVLERFPDPLGCTARPSAPPRWRRSTTRARSRCYTFTGASGDRIRARVIPTSGALNPVTEVLRPDGTTVCANTFADDQTCALDANGTHTVLVREGAGNGEAHRDRRGAHPAPQQPLGLPGDRLRPDRHDRGDRPGRRDRLLRARRRRRRPALPGPGGRDLGRRARFCSRSCAPTGPPSAGRPAPPRPPACSTPPAPTGSTSTPAAACRPPTTGSCSSASPTPLGCTAQAFGAHRRWRRSTTPGSSAATRSPAPRATASAPG